VALVEQSLEWVAEKKSLLDEINRLKQYHKALSDACLTQLALARRVGAECLDWMKSNGPEELQEIADALTRGDFEYLQRAADLGRLEEERHA
jgi:hypothetical protein